MSFLEPVPRPACTLKETDNCFRNVKTTKRKQSKNYFNTTYKTEPCSVVKAV